MKTITAPRIEIRRTDPIMCADADVAEGPEDLVPMLKEIMRGLEQEVFVVIIIGPRGRVVGYQEMARGRADSVEVPVRELFRSALLLDAHSLVVSHNHPSGDPTPSGPDKMLTKRLRKAGELIGCPVLDHIIIGGDRYFSFTNTRGGFAESFNLQGERQPPELEDSTDEGPDTSFTGLGTKNCPYDCERCNECCYGEEG